jgi:hypothetical protein
MDSKDSQCMLIEHYEEKYVTNMCFAAHILWGPCPLFLLWETFQPFQVYMAGFPISLQLQLAHPFIMWITTLESESTGIIIICTLSWPCAWCLSVSFQGITSMTSHCHQVMDFDEL